MITVLRVALVASLAVACDRQCVYGTFPPDGASDVRPSDVLFVRSFRLPADFPSPDRSITLVDESGADVSIDLDVDLAQSQIWVTPREPLQAGVAYTLRGLDSAELPLHWNGLLLEDVPGVSTFRVQGTPSLLGEYTNGLGALQFGWSEPVDPDSVLDALQIVGGVGVPVAAQSLDPFGRLIAVDVSWPEEATQAPVGLEVAFAEGVRTLAGAVLPALAAHAFGSVDNGIVPQVYDSRPYCVQL